MKWLYRILRLFVCPHKYELIQKSELNGTGKYPIGTAFTSKCRRCGNIKTKTYIAKR